ncbi:uncharacterized protein LOC118756517, partial [Rhagoletis pomonella]|uniref:uncharacterized protein LOC118756517 n=1 Tax=Rhagoletis pomonella TaxID=28610 RepID=UPI0017805D90
MWFSGPQFLLSQSNEWPHCEEFKGDEIDQVELKRYVLQIDRVIQKSLSLDTEYFSDWKRLYRAVATFLLYMNKLLAATKTQKFNKAIDFQMIQRAQIIIIKYAQDSVYREEINLLSLGKAPRKHSQLGSLNVYLDKSGVIKSKSRAEHLNSRADVIVLPNSHHVTFLIVRSIHEKFHHHIHEAIINTVRAQYYIPRLRVLYRKVRKSCQQCKNYTAKPNAPQMAVLPSARLAAFERPFTFVGIDFFGPLLVNVGRRREKRWGVLFTCLTLRAIHMEIAHSLDTSSCVMSIRNFVARRGYPRQIFTDNGTNFKAAKKIICAEMKEVDFSLLMSTFDQISWKFIPPAAPHMGGAWERLVRSVKSVLYNIMPYANFNDESLKSSLCEVEYIINARPLTFVSLESDDDDAITPNHLLLGSPDGFKPVCTDELDLRKRWYQTQKFADRFWHRWVKEYVPIISRRSKWFNKVPPIRVGDIVVIVDENLPRNCWPR